MVILLLLLLSQYNHILVYLYHIILALSLHLKTFRILDILFNDRQKLPSINVSTYSNNIS